jgi:hypothetical protein
MQQVEQRVVGDVENEHGHETLTHTHDHYHVSHHHRSGEMLGAFDHKSTYHSHEHDHGPLVHAHKDRDAEDERKMHDEMAHTHDHAMPSRRTAAL